MAEKILSVFIDESGDFGAFDPRAPYYLVAMVLHDQSIDISAEITAMENRMRNLGYEHHAIHTGPLIRRESIYQNDLVEDRKHLFYASTISHGSWTCTMSVQKCGKMSTPTS